MVLGRVPLYALGVYQLFAFSFLFGLDYPWPWNSLHGYEGMDILKLANTNTQANTQRRVNTCLLH